MWRMEMEITWAKATFTLRKWGWQIIEVQVMADFQEQRQSEQMKTGKHKISQNFGQNWAKNVSQDSFYYRKNRKK